VGEDVHFAAQFNYSADNLEWDFGDKTPKDRKSGMFVTHVYKNPGQYIVRLTINGECQEPKNINVNRREDLGKTLYLNPMWPSDTLYVGKEYVFTDNTIGALTWTWHFEKDEFPRNKQSMPYIFTQAGLYKVTLIINDEFEVNRASKTFTLINPPTSQVSTIDHRPPVFIPTLPNNNNTGSPATTPTIPTPPDNVGGIAVGQGMGDVLDEANKKPVLSDGTLKGMVLGINGSGYDGLKKYLYNSNYGKLTILFNNKFITIDQLKENMEVHQEFGEEFSVTHEVEPKFNSVNQIEIKAKLKKKNRILLKDKEREYPN
jgi:PKD repeat protein